MKVVLVTGVSGAGKTTAVHALEDLDFYCVDNLPMPLVSRFVELLAGRPDINRAALVTDARSGDFLSGARGVLGELRKAGHDVEVLFLDAPDLVLIRRFSETRRRHPLSGVDIRVGLQEERRRLEELRQDATSVIDTGTLTVHMLRALVLEHYSQSDGRLALTFLSFGFKHGLPAEADIVLDVRFLPNPFFVESLSARTGQEEDVRRFVLDREEAQLFLARAEDLLRVCLQGFIREGKSYATVAIGCTGGRHRSVALVEDLAKRFSVTHGPRDARGRSSPLRTNFDEAMRGPAQESHEGSRGRSTSKEGSRDGLYDGSHDGSHEGSMEGLGAVSVRHRDIVKS